MTAILFGSISTIADTSELQREAFNQAFTTHGLDWQWGREEYVELLRDNGGQDRIAAYASARGESVDAAAVHETKSEVFRQGLASGVPARPGVVETVREARARGHRVALVTTTSPDNVAALLDGVPDLDAGDFDLVVDATSVDQTKPHPAAYAFAVKTLDESTSTCVAIEDNLGGVAAAAAAGVACAAFPNANTSHHDFDLARLRVDRLDVDELMALTDTAAPA